MDFATLMRTIMDTRKLSVPVLAKEIGITAPSFRNLLARKIVKPDADTSEKILAYCRKHSIDTSSLD